MTLDRERAELLRQERKAWEALELARDVIAGRRVGELASSLVPLDQDMRAWAEKLMPQLEANWRRAHVAAYPKGDVGEHWRPERNTGRNRY